MEQQKRSEMERKRRDEEERAELERKLAEVKEMNRQAEEANKAMGSRKAPNPSSKLNNESGAYKYSTILHHIIQATLFFNGSHFENC